MSSPAGMGSSVQRLRAVQSHKDAALDLAATALDVASLNLNGKAVEPYRRHLETLCKDVGQFADKRANVENAAHALCQVLGRRYGYGGMEETFDDLNAANLMSVIDERRGLPVALGILYIHAARAQGWLARGIDFPGQFMVRLEVDGERVILNPFDGGIIVQTHELRDILKQTMGYDAELLPEHYRELDNRGVLLRLENNLKVRHLHAKRFDDALEAIETMLLLSPDNATLWREAGMIHVRLDQICEAIAALEEYLRLDTSGASRYTAGVLLQDLRSRLQ